MEEKSNEMMCNSMQINWKLPPPTSSKSSQRQMSDKALKLIQMNHNKRKNKVASSATSKSKKSDDKYGLRACSIQKRIEVEGRKGLPKKRGPKPRPKPLPMSKYRRKTANLRERIRMGEINVAFEKLRERIPTLIATHKNRCEKLTKINILHVAINYIKALENILNTCEPGIQVFGTSIVQSPLDIMDLDSDGKSECETTILRKKTAIKKKKQLPMLTTSSPNCSKDSGIGDDLDPEDILCPDWTELTSTLEFSSDPLLPNHNMGLKSELNFTKSCNFNQDVLNDYKQVSIFPAKKKIIPIILESIIFLSKVDVMFGAPRPFTPNSGLVQPIKFDYGHQTSFSELEVPETSDFLGDLTALEDSLKDSFHRIELIHDKGPFQYLVR